MCDLRARDVELYAICVVRFKNTSIQGHYLYCCVISRFLQNTSRYHPILLQQSRFIYFVFKTSVNDYVVRTNICIFRRTSPLPLAHSNKGNW